MDKNCQIVVQLHRGGTIRSGRTDADLITAINLATDQVIHAVVPAIGAKAGREEESPGEEHSLRAVR